MNTNEKFIEVNRHTLKCAPFHMKELTCIPTTMLFSSLHLIRAPVFESVVEYIEAIIKDIILIASLHFIYFAVCCIFFLESNFSGSVFYDVSINVLFCCFVCCVLPNPLPPPHTLATAVLSIRIVSPGARLRSKLSILSTHSADITQV